MHTQVLVESRQSNWFGHRQIIWNSLAPIVGNESLIKKFTSSKSHQYHGSKEEVVNPLSHLLPSPNQTARRIRTRRLGFDSTIIVSPNLSKSHMGCENWSFSPSKRPPVALIFRPMIVILHSELHTKKSARSSGEIKSYEWFTTGPLTDPQRNPKLTRGLWCSEKALQFREHSGEA